MDFMMNKPRLFHLNPLRNIDNQNPKFMRIEDKGFPSFPLEKNESISSILFFESLGDKRSMGIYPILRGQEKASRLRRDSLRGGIGPKNPGLFYEGP